MDVKKFNGTSWETTPSYVYKTATDTITTLPADLYTDGTSATATIKGNLSQSGTPTPSLPIYPSEMGDKTANLFTTIGATSGYLRANGEVVEHENLMHTDYIAIPTGATELTQSYGGYQTAMNAPALCFYDSNKSYISGASFNNLYEKTFSVPNNAKYIRTCYRTIMPWVMLNTGSTALPFEPWGYKIPILCNEHLTNIYLDAPLSEGEILYSTDIDTAIVTDIGDNELSVETTQQPTAMQIVYKIADR